MNENDPKMQAYLQNQFNGTKPHFDMENNMRAKVKKLFSPINPFEVDQIKTPNRIAFGSFKNHRFYAPDPLPNPSRFSRFLPVHYDALNDTKFVPIERFNEGSEATSLNRSYNFTQTKLPPVCDKYLFFYKRCAMINGSDKCKDEENEFLEVCPNFVLNKMKNKKMKMAQARLIQMKEYNDAMELSSYNAGRSIRDIDMTKRWKDGTAEKLRPDTFWNDDRYINVNDEDIAAAKERVKERQIKEGYIRSNTVRHPKKLDKDYEAYSTEKPLFEGN